MQKEGTPTVIVGAGPAGLHCARILAENDKQVIVLERKPRIDRKICTGMWGLSEKTERAGIPKKLLEKRFRKVVFRTPHRKVEVKLDKPFVATLDRKALGDWMLRQARKAGADIRFSNGVSRIGKDYVVVKGKKVSFSALVGADGSASIVRQSLGLPCRAGIGIQYWTKQKFRDMEIHFDAERFGPWYAWIAPHTNMASIGTGCDPSMITAKRIKANLDAWCRENGYDLTDAKFEGAPINYDYRGFHFKDKFLVGDAAGFTSGLTGEGIYFGMASGEDVARTIIDPKHRPALINSILRIKRRHEMIADAFKLNRTLERLEYNALLSLLKLKFFDKKAVELIA